ncbi:MAG: MauE/DoxX family redox-associated membrane protein [Ignavibacteriaceae bacterium]
MLVSKYENSIPLVLRLILGLVFFVSSMSKLFDIDTFTDTIFNYGFFSHSISGVIAVIVTITELLLSIMLIFNIRVKLASLFSALFMIIFIAATIPQILVGNVVDCNCFGFLLPGKTDISLVIKDTVLLIISLFIYAVESNFIITGKRALESGFSE